MTEPSGCRSSGSVLGELRDGRHWTRVKGSVAFSALKKQTRLSSRNRSGRWCRLWSKKDAGSRGKGITEVESRESRVAGAGAETNRDGTGCPGRLGFRGRGGETREGREPWVRRCRKAGMGIRTRGSPFGEDGQDSGGPAAKEMFLVPTCRRSKFGGRKSEITSRRNDQDAGVQQASSYTSSIR